MKEIILLLCGIVIGHQLMAQTFSEWFRQNHTQLKYLAGQIAALQGYDALLQRGYGIEQEGLDSIGSIAAGDVQLHAGHIDYLDKPSPAVREDVTIAAIQQYFTLIPIAAEEVQRVFAALPTAVNDWPTIGVRLGERLRALVTEGEVWLATLLGDDRYRMDDAERLRRLAEMETDLRKTYGNIMYLLAQLDTSAINPLI